ncbi:MAG: TRAP transporter small permease subunit [Burkholderiales bacterium]|jgi:TRAP-type mannitol/chloroaromatic compound transport system permease small subunit|nr:TRAP transporter small permease subunit [Burkholderiales bacterium]
MKGLLSFAHAIDWLNERVGRIAVWAVLIACLVSAGNATLRYLISNSSNAWLELQWYLFGAMVLLGAPFVLKMNEHVRVDVIYSRLGPKGQACIDLFGLVLFLMPAACLLAWMSWPWFVDSFVHSEMSSNAGGLIRWPVKLMLPVGFTLLVLQGLAEIVKRVAFLRGEYAMDLQYERPLQ